MIFRIKGHLEEETFTIRNRDKSTISESKIHEEGWLWKTNFNIKNLIIILQILLITG